MHSLNFFQRRFTPPLWACLLTAVTATLFLTLGFWQLHRAEEKRHILSALTKANQYSAKTWQFGDSPPEAYQKLVVTGHFLPDLFLLDNQHLQHQIGYNVISPFLINGGQIILIDRGWVAADSSRHHLPHIDTPEHLLTLSGSAYYPSSKSLIIGPEFEKDTPLITVIEHLNLVLISDFLHKSVNPFIIRMAPELPYGYNRTWIAVSMPPERHLGYALQWFTMAIITVILLVSLNIKTTKDP